MGVQKTGEAVLVRASPCVIQHGTSKRGLHRLLPLKERLLAWLRVGIGVSGLPKNTGAPSCGKTLIRWIMGAPTYEWTFIRWMIADRRLLGVLTIGNPDLGFRSQAPSHCNLLGKSGRQDAGNEELTQQPIAWV